MVFLFSVLITGAPARADTPSVHGMIVFGSEKNLYASHLPMFHAPHDRQVILKIALKGILGSQAVAAYMAAKKSGKTFFTIEPEIMDLEKIVNGLKTEFTASIYEGHFERGGQNLGRLKILVKKIVLASHLNGLTPPQQDEKYFVFGEKGDIFAVHLIQGKPSFDAILVTSNPYVLHFPHCHTRVCPEPTRTLLSDEKLPLILVGPTDPQTLQGNSGLTLGDLSGGSADVKTVLYLEEGDLSH